MQYDQAVMSATSISTWSLSNASLIGTGRAYCIPHPLFGTQFLHQKIHATPLIRNTTRFAKKKVETFSIRQTANPSLQLRVCSFALPSFYISARRSVQFSSFLFSQNIIQYKNTYRNCKVAREPRRNQNANEAWASQFQRNKLNRMKFAEWYI